MSRDDDKEIGKAPSTVLVTGAAGGLGVHVVRLLDATGWKVRALDLVAPVLTGRSILVDHLGDVEWIVGPADAEGLAEAMRDCVAVVHTAGATSLSADDDHLFRQNLELSRRIFSSACDADVSRFVHISCASVYRADTGVRTEDSPTETYNCFEDSKLDAEVALRRLCDERSDAPSLTILRLGLLYGPGCTTMGAGMVTLPAILRGISSLLPGLSGGPRTNWCHVEDAARAIELVLRDDRARDEIFNVADETALSFGEVLTSITEGYGIDLGPSVRVPTLALWTLLSPIIDNDWAFEQTRALLRLMWRRIQRAHGLDSPLVPRLDRDAIFYVRDDAVVVAEKIKELGWEPGWPDFREGISHTIRWYQEHKWAPRFDPEALAERRDGTPKTRLSYDEHHRGRLIDEGTHLELEFTVTWPELPLPPFRREAHIEGTISLEGRAARRPLQGTVELRWAPRPCLDYQFGFEDDNGQPCRFQGRRRLSLSRPLQSLHRLEGIVVDHRGIRIGRAVMHRTEGVVPLLLSHRLSDPP